MRVPSGGLQPQVVADPTGGLHLIYFFRGQEASSGDLYYTYYTRRARGATRFSEPIRVNSVSGSAVATGSVWRIQAMVGHGLRHRLPGGSAT